MPTPSDQRIEDRLATLRAESPGETPGNFLGAVRARRRVVIARRGAVVGGVAAALVLAAVVLRPEVPTAPSAPPQGPIASAPPTHTPPLDDASMLSLRLAWSEGASDEAEGGDWLAALPVGFTAGEAERPLRVSDVDRLLTGL